MVLELHVWGPAFGLPSIDAECIAAVAYLNRLLLEHQWKLVADHDTQSSPNHDFPVLRHGSTWIAGFNAIVRYLGTTLDKSLSSGRVHADHVAYSTLIQANAQPLLDLFLYATYENYTSTMCPAFTKILPWYVNYTVPPARRAAAKARTQHLGLSSLDLEPSDEAPRPGGSVSSQYEAAKRAASVSSAGKGPNLLPLGSQRKPGGLLGQAQHANRFKLNSLANALFTPLSDLLAEKRYLLSDEPSSLDCLALGYLSLMLYAPAPQPWLPNILKARFRRLEQYVRRLRETLLGSENVDVEAVTMLGERSRQAAVATAKGEKGLKLPWSPPLHQNAFDVAAKAGWDIIEALAGPRWRSLVQHTPAEAVSTSAHDTPITPMARFLAVWSAGLAGFVSGVAFSSIWFGSEDHESYSFDSTSTHHPTRLTDFGEAGAALAALGNQLELEAAYKRQRERMGGAPVMEVDAEVKSKGESVL